MLTSDFLQSNMALNNSIRTALDKSNEETWEENLKEALTPFGADIVTNLGHLKFG